ncbi:uncharacterized protein LOC120705094 [Panicum virgatum]|uniref:uncharacterized protein LOC120705094 n=1 Tax=Panicum virgatum TaxID=38727 RepID=UPI0019D63D63|nr:uncharacterized protein LOC120705094 [Panicum virgatum]
MCCARLATAAVRRELSLSLRSIAALFLRSIRRELQRLRCRRRLAPWPGTSSVGYAYASPPQATRHGRVPPTHLKRRRRPHAVLLLLLLEILFSRAAGCSGKASWFRLCSEIDFAFPAHRSLPLSWKWECLIVMATPRQEDNMCIICTMLLQDNWTSTAAQDISVSPDPIIFVLPAIKVFDEMHPQ